MRCRTPGHIPAPQHPPKSQGDRPHQVQVLRAIGSIGKRTKGSMAPVEVVGESPQQLLSAIQTLQHAHQGHGRRIDRQRPKQPLHAVARKPRRAVARPAFPPGRSHQPIASRSEAQDDGQILPECPQRPVLIMGLRQPLDGFEIIDLDAGSHGMPRSEGVLKTGFGVQRTAQHVAEQSDHQSPDARHRPSSADRLGRTRTIRTGPGADEALDDPQASRQEAQAIERPNGLPGRGTDHPRGQHSHQQQDRTRHCIEDTQYLGHRTIFPSLSAFLKTE